MPTNLYSEVRPHLYFFLKQLENYNDTPFNKKLKGEDISVGYIFQELCEEFNLRIIPSIEQCIAGGNPEAKGKTVKGIKAFLFNKGVRAESTTFAEAFEQNAIRFSIPVLRDEIYRIIKRMEKLGSDLNAMTSSELKNNKILHPELGYLTAKDWFKLSIINLEMYRELKQKLDKKIS